MEVLQMAMLEPRFLILDETDSGLDIDALKVVSDGVNALRSPNRAMLVITHYQRLLDHIKPDRVHVLVDGRIVRSGGPIGAGTGSARLRTNILEPDRLMLQALDIFDPSSYPTRRDEDWKYSDLSRVLRVVPANAEQSDDGDIVEVAAGKSMKQLVRLTDGGTYNEMLRFRLGEGAELIRVIILDEPEDAVSIYRSTVETAPGSTFKQYVFSTGAKFQRFETHVEHAGHGASVELHGAYLLKDKAHFDLTTRVNHTQPDGQDPAV